MRFAGPGSRASLHLEISRLRPPHQQALHSQDQPLKRADLDEFVACYNPANRHTRKATWSGIHLSRVQHTDELRRPQGPWPISVTPDDRSGSPPPQARDRKVAFPVSSGGTPLAARTDGSNLEGSVRTKSVTAAVLVALTITPSLGLAQGKGNGRSKQAQGIPPGHLPPPGACRVWIDGRPPGHQPPPTDCRSAEITASHTRYARVIYGDRTERRDDGRWRDDRDTGEWRDEDRRRDGGRDDERRGTGRAIPRSDDPGSYPQGRYPDTRNQNHPGWSNGYRDGQVKGREDVSKNRSYDPKRHQWYRSASRGYESRYGLRGGYANIYREGFEAGYAEEFREIARVRR